MTKSLGVNTEYLRGSELWRQVLATTESALAGGALQPIPTHCYHRPVAFHGHSLNFQVRVVDNLARKARDMRERAAQAPTPEGFNPFLPYDTALYVGELTARYRCLLNKFNVMNQHALMVTTTFAQQREPLHRDDFLAAALCLQAHEGLVFYNGGREAGASVEHKHLQMIPLPFGAPTEPPFPLAALFADLQLAENGDGLSCPHLPFRHSIAKAVYLSDDAETAADTNCRRYQQLLQALNLTPEHDGLMPPHNMLLTRNYLWVVPRTRESHQGIAVNALGFAGTFLVKDEQQLAQLGKIGAMEILMRVSG